MPFARFGCSPYILGLGLSLLVNDSNTGILSVVYAEKRGESVVRGRYHFAESMVRTNPCLLCRACLDIHNFANRWDSISYSLYKFGVLPPNIP